MRFTKNEPLVPAYVKFINTGRPQFQVALVSTTGKPMEWEFFSPAEIKTATRYAEALATANNVKVKK